MSQKELLEEGFSDKIRGIASAVKTGVQQAARQGVRLDTGLGEKGLLGGMGKAYKGEQPIAVLKKALAGDKTIEIVKIDKSNIKKQQASGKKGYIGRIVGPKSITLIPFQGVLYGGKEGVRRYEGEGAGIVKEDTAVMDVTRGPSGQYTALHPKGSVEKQAKNTLIKSGVEEKAAGKLAQYASKAMTDFLKYVKETHPNIKFTSKADRPLPTGEATPELGVYDVPDKDEPGGEKFHPESLSLTDIIQLSRKILIIEASQRRNALSARARELGLTGYSRMRIADLEKAIADAEAQAGKEVPGVEPKEEVKPKKPWKGPPPLEEEPYINHREFIASLDDEVIVALLKNLQQTQVGAEIKFEEEKQKKEGPKSDFQGEEGMFVAELFRTGKGLEVGEIYRQDDPTVVVWPNKHTKKKGDEAKTKTSPFDEVVTKLTDENQLNAQQLVARLKLDKRLKNKKMIINLDTATILKPIPGRTEAQQLSPDDIKKVKAELIRQRIIKEGTSQKNLLRQLTLLSR